ncbi:hypothetical protein ACFE04_008282 [Oxalis oulophora]
MSCFVKSPSKVEKYRSSLFVLHHEKTLQSSRRTFLTLDRDSMYEISIFDSHPPELSFCITEDTLQSTRYRDQKYTDLKSQRWPKLGLIQIFPINVTKTSFRHGDRRRNALLDWD